MRTLTQKIIIVLFINPSRDFTLTQTTMNCPCQLPWCVSPALLRRAGTYDGALMPSYGTPTAPTEALTALTWFSVRFKWFLQLSSDAPQTSNPSHSKPDPNLTPSFRSAAAQCPTGKIGPRVILLPSNSTKCHLFDITLNLTITHPSTNRCCQSLSGPHPP